MAVKYVCDRCGKEMSLRRAEAYLAVYHDNGKSYSLSICASIIGDLSPNNCSICEDCVKELTKKAVSGELQVA